MTRLTSVHGSFGAYVLAARLEAEGFEVQLRGAIHSPYALTVGDMSVIDVWVREDQIEDASYLLLVDEVEEVLEYDGPSRRRVTPLVRFVAGALIVTAVLSLAQALF